LTAPTAARPTQARGDAARRQVAATEPSTSMLRQASSITIAVKPWSGARPHSDLTRQMESPISAAACAFFQVCRSSSWWEML